MFFYLFVVVFVSFLYFYSIFSATELENILTWSYFCLKFIFYFYFKTIKFFLLMSLEDNQMNCSNLFNTNKRKHLRCPEASIVNYVSRKSVLNSNETNSLNHKRIIQMLDLFNSKYYCKVCCSKLRYKADQIIHSQLKHKIKTKDTLNNGIGCAKRPIIKCPKCENSFSSYFHLKFHLMRKHLNEKPYGCRACQVKFYSFSRLRKHCFAKHIGHARVASSSSCSSSSFSVSSFSSNSSNMSMLSDNSSNGINLIDLINYENSKFQVDSSMFPNDSKKCSSNLLLNSFENPLSINSESNLKYFAYLDRIKSSKVKNFETLVAYLKETKTAKKTKKSAELTNTNTFTIIVQLNITSCNLCTKLCYSNTDYLTHIWYKHISVDSFVSSHVCWPCVYQAKTNDLITAINKNSFNEKKHLDKHFFEFKHLNQKAFRCSECFSSQVYFSDLNAIKEHYLLKHLKANNNNHSFEINSNQKSYLEEMLDLASNLDDDNAEIRVLKSVNSSSIERYSFVFACFKCEQIFMNYESILKHFEQNSTCNQNFSLKKIKCNKCSVLLYNSKQYEVHLKQHEYLDHETGFKFNNSFNNNIKNSKNNKSYSIDAIVNSINNNKLARSSNRIDDIAFRIISMKKSQESVFNQTATDLLTSSAHSLMPLFQQFNNSINDLKILQNSMAKSASLNQPILNKTKLNNSFSFDQDENINQYNSLLNKMIKSSDSYNNSLSSLKRPSTLYASSNSAFSSNPFCYSTSSSNSGYNQHQKLNIQNSNSLDNTFKLNSIEETNLKLLKHNNEIKNKMLNQHKCEYCGYFFSSLAEFTLHRTMHQALNPKRPFKCHLCQVTFAKTDQLIRHMIVHQASDQDSVCQVCYSSFSRKQDLDRHMLFHSK